MVQPPGPGQRHSVDLSWLFVADRGLKLITGEDSDQERLLCQRVGFFVEPPSKVVELESIELIFQSANLLTIGCHLGVMTI